MATPKPYPQHLQRASDTMQAAGKLTPEASQALRIAAGLYHRCPQYNASQWQNELIEKLKRKLNNHEARPAI